jgi:hypothetical protein
LISISKRQGKNRVGSYQKEEDGKQVEEEVKEDIGVKGVLGW